MTGVISSLCVSHVTQEYMQREVTDGMEERVIHTNDGHFKKGRGVQISVSRAVG